MKTTLCVALIVAVVTHNAGAQTTWQPADGRKQIVLWPDGPPDPRPATGVEALHYALNGKTKQKKLVGGKPYMYIEHVTQPTVTIYPASTKATATPASTRFDRLYPAVDDADKASSRPDFALVLYPGRVAQRKSFIPNPDIQVTGRTSPTFLVHAYDDPMNPVENSLAYAAALRKAGVPAEIHSFANGGLAFGQRRTAATATAWAPLAEAWLQAIGIIGQ